VPGICSHPICSRTASWLWFWVLSGAVSESQIGVVLERLAARTQFPEAKFCKAHKVGYALYV
jgi:hypothetical protein